MPKVLAKGVGTSVERGLGEVSSQQFSFSFYPRFYGFLPTSLDLETAFLGKHLTGASVVQAEVITTIKFTKKTRY